MDTGRPQASARSSASLRPRRAELAHDELLEAIDAIPEGFVIYDRDDRLLVCNRAFREINIDIADLIEPGVPFEALVRAQASRAARALGDGANCGVDCGPRCSDWTLCRAQVHFEPRGVMFETTAAGRWVRIDEHRTPSGLRVGLRTDLSDVRDAQAQLARSEAKFRALYATAPVGIVRTSIHGLIHDANPTFAVITGSGPEDTRRLPELFDPRDRAAFEADMEDAARMGAFGPVERRLVGPDGGTITLLVQGTTVTDTTGTLSLWSFLQDISDRKRMEARVWHAAHHDGLTGLPNRSGLSLRLGAGERRRRGDRFGLLLIDLDNFKVVNDSLGHEAGDVLLQSVAARLAGAMREGDFVARLGGDEFAVLVEEVEDERGLEAFARRLFDRLGEEISYRDRPIRVGASIGMALAPDGSFEPNELLRWADMALYEAKRAGRNRLALFTPAMEEANRRRYEVVAATRRALHEDRVVPHYQPIVDLETGALCGFEALCRIVGEEGLAIRPIEIFEHPEIAGAVDLRMLERVCDDLVRWREGGLDDVPVSLNVCDAEFWRDGFAEQLCSELERRDLPMERLSIEVTESAFLTEDVRDLVPILEGLRRRGIASALDDFGTGYASLTHLKSLPIDRVKVDRSFVVDVVFDLASRAIVDSLVRLAQGLGKQLVAEGIETEAQRRALIDLGCRFGQGFLLGRPVPAAEVVESWGEGADPSIRRRVV